MSILRRGIQVVALVGTLLIGILAVSLIVSQTPWFKDWLRRYVMRQSSQYLNGQLTIGGLGGNLFFGLDLSDVAIDMAGERVVSVKDLELDYSVVDFISRGLVLDDIRITEPRLVLRQNGDGSWNLAALIKQQEQEADREGPGRPVTIGSIGISDGHIVVDKAATPVGTTGTTNGGEAVNIPERIRRLDAKMSFRYEPVRFTLVMDHLSFRTSDPELDVNRVQGTVAVRADDLHLEEVKVHTADSALHVDGVIEQYATKPVFRLEAASERLSLPELARVVPAIGSRRLHPSFEISARGPLEALQLKVNARSEAGEIDADALVDAEGPARAVRGEVAAGNLDLAPLLDDPAQKSDITGRAQVDLTIPAAGMNAARGRWRFSGPRAAIAGYEARNIEAKGELQGPRITLDGRAEAYGGAATARGFVVRPADGRPLGFSIDGRASNVNLRGLPAALDVPRLTTDLNTTYHVEGSGARVAGRAALDRSTVEGATIAEGTVASFASNGPGRVEYAAKGAVADLDLRRIGRAMRIEAISASRFESDVNAQFDLKGSGTTVEAMTLDASGRLTDSRLFGGDVPGLAFEAHLADGALKARATGELAGFDPAALSGRADLKGTIGGEIDVQAGVPDVTGPLRLETVEATARVALAKGRVGEIDVDGGVIDASASAGMVDVREITIEGPDLDVKAAGQVAVTQDGASNLKYHVATPSLEQVGKLVGQPLSGSAIIDGTVTGTPAALHTTGTLDGSNLRYGENGALDVSSTFDVTVPDLRPSDARVGADTEATFVKLGGTEIQEIRAKTTYADDRIEFDATVRDRGRELRADGNALLHPDHSEVHLPGLSLRSQGIEWRLAGESAAVQYGSKRVSFQNVELRSGSQVLAVDGAIATGDRPSGELTVRAANVDLKQLQDLLLVDRGVAGQFSADARLTGSLSAPRVEGSVAITNGAFRDFTFESLTSKVNYTAQGMQLDARLQQNPEHWLTVRGFTPMSLFRREPSDRAEHVEESAADRVDLRVESSEIDLGVVQGFTTQVTDVQGRLKANLHVTGSGRDPHLDGTIDIRNGAFSLPAGGTSYRGLDTTIQLTRDKVVVPGFQILDEEDHPLLVAGEIAVHSGEVGAVNVTLQADSFELIDNELGDVGVDANVRVTGEMRRPRIEGEVSVEDGRIEVDQVLAMVSSPYATEVSPEALEPGAEAADSVAGASDAAADALKATERDAGAALDAAAADAEREREGAQAQGTLIDQLSMDVRVDIPDNLVLRGQDLRPGGPGGLAIGDINVTVGGDLRVRKAPGDELRFIGTVNTVRGFYEFQGRRFELQRDGLIRFVGLESPNPVLDIRATRLISGVEAIVHVRGTARAPELELSSNPPLDRADILSLIVFNRSINDLNEGERVSLAQRAGAIASGFVAAPLAQSIGQALDVDLFEIEPIEMGGQMGAGVTLGQQIGEHLFVKFHQEFGPQDISEFIIEYQLADFLRLKTSAAPNGGYKASRVALRRIERAGADLIFFFSY
jgi:hypothetical protein